MRSARLTLAFAVAVALSAVAVCAARAATTPIIADDVVVTTSAALSVANEPGYTLHYHGDGTASYDGPLNGRDGHYEAHVDFAPVQTVVSDAGLCERSGIPRYIEAPALSTSARQVQKRDVLMQLRCASGAPPFDLKTFNNKYTPELPAVADALLKIGAGLDWRYIGPARRGMGVRFIQ